MIYQKFHVIFAKISRAAPCGAKNAFRGRHQAASTSSTVEKPKEIQANQALPGIHEIPSEIMKRGPFLCEIHELRVKCTELHQEHGYIAILA